MDVQQKPQRVHSVFYNLSYDGMFLLQYLLSQTVQPSFVIYRGSKIQMFTLKQFDIRVIDSFNFLPMRISPATESFSTGFSDQRLFPSFFPQKCTDPIVCRGKDGRKSM